MKSISIIILLLSFPSLAHQGVSQITVGVITSGVPSLILSDTQLSDTLAFTLNGATLQNATTVTGTDTLGTFYYIKADGIRSGQANPSQIAIILEAIGSNLIFSTGTGCTMECISGLPCTRCDQTIYEKCKRQSCSCASQNGGGCTASITFPDSDD